jgi:DNA mismatch repair protein MLH3
MPLSLLDAEVRSRLRSGVAITSMAQCARELVENGIDAGAKCVAVRVDVSKYKIQVLGKKQWLVTKDLLYLNRLWCHSVCTVESVPLFAAMNIIIASGDSAFFSGTVCD